MAVERQTFLFEVTSDLGVVVSRADGGIESNLLPIASDKLNDQNYLQWFQFMMTFICESNKDDYINESMTTPKFCH